MTENQAEVTGTSAVPAEPATAAETNTQIFHRLQAELDAAEPKADTNSETNETNLETSTEDKPKPETNKSKTKSEKAGIVEREVKARQAMKAAKDLMAKASEREALAIEATERWYQAEQLYKSGQPLEALEQLGFSAEEISKSLMDLATGKDPKVDAIKRELDEIKRDKALQEQKAAEAEKQKEQAEVMLNYDKHLARTLHSTDDPYNQWLANDRRLIREVAKIQELYYDGGKIMSPTKAAQIFLREVKKVHGNFLDGQNQESEPAQSKSQSTTRTAPKNSHIEASSNSRLKTDDEIRRYYVAQLEALSRS